MKINLICLLFLFTNVSCNVNKLGSEKQNKKSFVSNYFPQKFDFIEKDNVFFCGKNRLEINKNVALLFSHKDKKHQEYSFDFFGFNPKDGVFILADNENKMFTMIDLSSGKELIQYSSKHPIIGLYTFPTSRYFIETKQIENGIEEREVREIEPDLQRTMVVDLEADDMTKLEIRTSEK
jgi:hypothetical protein